MAILGQQPFRVRAGVAVAVLALAAALLFAASDDAPASKPATASRTATVEVVNFAFRPGTLKVAKGTDVVFSNASSRPHTATRSGGFNTGRIKPGRSASVRFGRKGTFRYHCNLHLEMRGKVVVG